MESTQYTESNVKGLEAFVNFALTKIGDEVVFSKDMYQLGSKTTIVQVIENSFTNPLKFSIDGIKNNHDAAAAFINSIFVSYLKAKKNLISKAYKYGTETGINYFLILNDDNSENREEFFKLIDEYETLDIHNHLPLFFTFLPPEAAGKMQGAEEIFFN